MKDFNKDWEQYNFESVTPVISWPWNWVPKKKEKQKLESWVSVRPQHLQTNLLKQSKGRWAAKSSSKRLWVWGAKGLLPSVQWTSLPGAVNCHNSNVASTGPREGKEHMGEKGRKKKKKDEKRWIQELCLHFYLRFTAFLLMGTSLAILASSAQHSACSLIQALLFVGKENIFLNKQREMDIKRMQAA